MQFEKEEVYILERYWKLYPELSKQPREELGLIALSVVDGISELYETLNDDYKKLVEMRYWSPESCYEFVEIADELYVSRIKAIRMRDYLIAKTAKAVHFI